MFHELGHFIAARAVGIRVEEFAIGFGPKLIRLFKRGDTEYTIHPFPLGGFVKLAGMEPGEVDIPDGFQAQAIWKRAITIFAGPFFSLLLAVLVFVFLGVYWGFQDFSHPLPEIAQVQPQTEAARVGLRAGDRVLEINGVKITRGAQMTEIIHGKAGQKLVLLIDRDGKRMTRTAYPKWVVQYLGTQWSFMNDNRATINDVYPKSAAKKAGLKEKDQLTAIDGKPVHNGQDMVNAIKRSDGRSVRLEILRDKRTIELTVKPKIEWVQFAGAKWLFPGGLATDNNGEFDPNSTVAKSGIKLDDMIVSINGTKIKTGEDMLTTVRLAKGKALNLVMDRDDDKVDITMQPTMSEYKNIQNGNYSSIGLLGFLPKPKLIKVGFVESVQKGILDFGRMVSLLVKSLSSKDIQKDVGGPVMIAKVTESAVALGPYWVLMTLANLSLSLGIINLVPIPILDGGHLAILGVEAIRRKRLTIQQMAAVQMVGLAIIVLLAVVVFFSDISKILGGQIPQ